MHPLYSEAMETADQLREARLKVARLATELSQVEYDLGVTAARVERGLIKQVGDVKRLGPTTDARERVFVLARDADETYLAHHRKVTQARQSLEEAQVEVKALQDRLTVMLTAMRAGGEV